MMTTKRTSLLAVLGPLAGLALSLLLACASRGVTLVASGINLEISAWEWASTLTLAALGAPVTLNESVGLLVGLAGTVYAPPLLLTALICLGCYLPARLTRHWTATHSLMSGVVLAVGAGAIWLTHGPLVPNPFFAMLGGLLLGTLAPILAGLARGGFGHAWRWAWCYVAIIAIPVGILGAIAGARYLGLPYDSFLPWVMNMGLSGWAAGLGGFAHAELHLPSLFGASIPPSFGQLAGATPLPIVIIALVTSVALLGLFAAFWSSRAAAAPRWGLPLAFALIAAIDTAGGMIIAGHVAGGLETISLHAYFVPSPINIPAAALLGFAADRLGLSIARKGSYQRN